VLPARKDMNINRDEGSRDMNKYGTGKVGEASKEFKSRVCIMDLLARAECRQVLVSEENNVTLGALLAQYKYI